MPGCPTTYCCAAMLPHVDVMKLHDWDAMDFATQHLVPDADADPPVGCCYLRSYIETPGKARIKAYRYPQPEDNREPRTTRADGSSNYQYTLPGVRIFGPVKEFKFVMSGEWLAVRVPHAYDPKEDVWINIARMKRNGREWDWFCHAIF